MPKFLTNLSQDSTLQIKEGKYIVKSGHSVQVSENDIKDGLFEDLIAKGLVEIKTHPSQPDPLYPIDASILPKSIPRDGFDYDQINAYLSTQVETDKAPAGKVTSLGRTAGFNNR